MEIYKKIIKISQEVASIKKDGKNKMQNYNYISHEETIKCIRTGMLKSGIIYFADLQDVSDQEIQTKNSKMILTKAKFKHVFINADKPEEKIEFINYGYGTDTMDKGIYKAITGAKKYAFFTLFMLVDGLDGQNSDPENSNFESKQQFQQQKEKSKQPNVFEIAKRDIERATLDNIYKVREKILNGKRLDEQQKEKLLEKITEKEFDLNSTNF